MRFHTAIILSLSLCPALAVATPDSAAHLVGANSSSYRVLVRAIDDGDVLWADGYTLSTNATISPGKHKISLMCETTTDYGTNLDPGEITLDVEAGKTYDLDVSGGDSRRCEIVANSRT